MRANQPSGPHERDEGGAAAREQELLRQLRECEQSLREQELFAAALVHDLRTPLHAVLGFTGALLEELPGPLNPAQRGQLERVRSSGEHLLALVEQLLDLARLRAGASALACEPLDLAALLAELAATLEPLARARSLDVRVVHAGGPAPLAGDARALRQILFNLAGNAIKHGSSGEVRLELEPREAASGGWRVRVVDGGPGLSAEDQARLFRAYATLGAPGAREGGSSGLGLFVARRLAGLCGGTLELESRPGLGCTFTLELPARG